MIDAARRQVAHAANAALTALYWEIGTRIRRDVLKERRAEYGAEILAAVGRQLGERYGRGFGEQSLRRMVQFAEAFPDRKILVSLIRELTWTHFIALIPLKVPLKRDFYTEMCRAERWSVRELRAKIDSMLYERTALSRKPEELIRKELAALRDGDKVTPDLVFQDPYLLDFLGLKDTYSEKDLEAALLREIERFLLEPPLELAHQRIAHTSIAMRAGDDHPVHVGRLGVREMVVEAAEDRVLGVEGQQELVLGREDHRRARVREDLQEL